VAAITDGLTARVEALNKGLDPVVESQHVIVAGAEAGEGEAPPGEAGGGSQVERTSGGGSRARVEALNKGLNPVVESQHVIVAGGEAGGGGAPHVSQVGRHGEGVQGTSGGTQQGHQPRGRVAARHCLQVGRQEGEERPHVSQVGRHGEGVQGTSGGTQQGPQPRGRVASTSLLQVGRQEGRSTPMSPR